MTSRAGLRPRAEGLAGPTLPATARDSSRAEALGALGRLGRHRAPLGHAVAVLDAERAGRILGQGIAIALAVGGPNEGSDDLEVPLGDVVGLPPEVGKAKVDIELEQIDP